MKKTLNRTRRAVRGADEYEVDRSVRRDLQSNCPSTYRFRLFKAPMGVSDEAMGETVRHIQEVVNQRRTIIREKDLDALMAVYSEHYRYQDLTKADMRTIWKGFFEH